MEKEKRAKVEDPFEAERAEVAARKVAWGCRGVDEYTKLNNISEGAYGVVSRVSGAAVPPSSFVVALPEASLFG